MVELCDQSSVMLESKVQGLIKSTPCTASCNVRGAGCLTNQEDTMRVQENEKWLMRPQACQSPVDAI